MENKFQVGDKISAFGVEGEVVRISDDSNYPIRCNVQNHSVSFTAAGKYMSWHKEPSLKLIKRPKKKVKKYRVLYKRGNGFNVSLDFYKSEEDFRMHNVSELEFKFIQLIKESEIEV